MKVLIDQNLSPKLADALRGSGHDVAHTAEKNLATASDLELFDVCRRENRLLITADVRLTKFIADYNFTDPTVIIVRGYRRDEDMTSDLLKVITLAEQLLFGGDHAIISQTLDRPARVRLLPLNAGSAPED